MNNWKDIIEGELEKDYFKNIIDTVTRDREAGDVYPPKEQVFTAFNVCELDNVKVVISGQDPYHQPGQAHGLAFSVNKKCVIPPSLRNIYKELRTDLGIDVPKHGSLISWARQGVLLLNASLTVKRDTPNSHKDIGWAQFNKTIFKTLNAQDKPIVFMLWGRSAAQLRYLITNPQHLILEAAHPSPLSAHNGFFGCKHFSLANEFLRKHDIKPIDWSIDS